MRIFVEKGKDGKLRNNQILKLTAEVIVLRLTRLTRIADSVMVLIIETTRLVCLVILVFHHQHFCDTWQI